jgi:hypothetical protein
MQHDNPGHPDLQSRTCVRFGHTAQQDLYDVFKERRSRAETGVYRAAQHRCTDESRGRALLAGKRCRWAFPWLSRPAAQGAACPRGGFGHAGNTVPARRRGGVDTDSREGAREPTQRPQRRR